MDAYPKITEKKVRKPLTCICGSRSFAKSVGRKKSKASSSWTFSKGRRGRGVFVVFWYQDEAVDLANAHVAQLVERVLGKDEVISSILIMGSRMRKLYNTAQDYV